MLTGDSRARAEKVAEEIGMSEVNAQLLPDEKLEKAEQLKKSGALMYVGDGINDAPVMAAADCSVSMGKLGSAAAVEASDLVLVSDNLKAIPRGIPDRKKDAQDRHRKHSVFHLYESRVYGSRGGRRHAALAGGVRGRRRHASGGAQLPAHASENQGRRNMKNMRAALRSSVFFVPRRETKRFALTEKYDIIEKLWR